MTKPQEYRDALLEYMAMRCLEEDLRGTGDYKLRSAVSSRKNHARDKLEKLVAQS